MNKPILHIENACISFGHGKLFTHFNLDLHLGEMYCITGESGKGKTSLLNAILGFVPLSEGSIVVDGLILGVSTIDEIRKRVAWIPQELSIPSEWVSEMVRISFKLKANRNIKFSEKTLYKHFEALGLEHDLLERRVTEISGGQRQRIMIAVTTMLQKPLMIIDEPTSALDPASVSKVIRFLKNETQKSTAILAVTHDRIFADSCDKRIFL